MIAGRWWAVAVVNAVVGSFLAVAPDAAVTPASPDITIYPTVAYHLASLAAPLDTAQCEQLYQIACYEPAQIQTAYDEGPLFRQGIDGSHQTIAIVDAFGSPTIESDLATFDTAFHLPPAQLRVLRPAGPVPPFDPSNATMRNWAGETTLDVEWAHVMAPGAEIVLLETPVAQTEGTAGFAQVQTAEEYAIDHHMADVISQSFSASEPTLPPLPALDRYRQAYIQAYRHHDTVLAAAGDTGATEPSNPAGTLLYPSRVTTWPPSDPLVTGVGGTQLHLDASGNHTAPDNVWNDGGNSHLDQLFFGTPGPYALASGGGKSVLFRRPDFQDSVAGVVGYQRGVPDVSMSAACDGAAEVYQSFPGINPGWYLSCGTSEAVPLFAGVVAVADQAAHHTLGLINPLLYRLAAEHTPGIVDVTSGDNSVAFSQGGKEVSVTGFAATKGYDLASGVGTVDVAQLVREITGNPCLDVRSQCQAHQPPDRRPGSDHGRPGHSLKW